jgi:ankyrin repeat protein
MQEVTMSMKRLGAWLVGPLVAVVNLGAVGSDARLVDAVKKADRAAVRTLLQKHVDVNAPEADGMTALHWAAERGDVETSDLLIRAGANVKAVTRYGVTPLSLACISGNAALVEALLKAGADANGTSPEGETPLMTAARVGKVDTLKVLVAHGAEVNAKENWKGQSAIMWAAGEGHTEAIRTLTEVGADINARSKGGFSPLLFAVRNGHLEAARLLIASGADPNDKVMGSAPAGGMSGRGNVTTGRQPGGDVSTSALGMAIINGAYELAAMLLEKGADPNIPDPRGSALHALAFMRRPGSGNPALPQGNLDTLDLAKALLAHGANPNARITWKEIVFDRDLAATRLPPNIPVGRNFLSFIGATPFYVAAKHGDVALMRLLVASGADPKLPTVQGITPLMAAAGLGFWDGESPGPLTGVPENEAVEAVQMTLELGNDINAVTRFGGPAMQGDGGTLLRRHPINLEKYDGPHDAPLDVIPPKESLGDMRWDGSTALHGAAMRGSNAIVQFLVNHGARLDAKNTLGWTPLMCAEGVFVANTEKDWPDTVELLRKLMKEHGLNPDLYNQASLGVRNSRDVSDKP